MDRRTFLQGALLSATAAPLLSGCSEPPAAPTPVQAAPTPPPTALPPEIPTPLLTSRKGIGLGVGQTFTVEQLNSLNVDWFYTWGASHPGVWPRADFVPMIWGRNSTRRGAVERVQAERLLTRPTELLGFNEPDHPEQSDMSVSSAIKLWPRLQATGLRLGSPAPVDALGDWLKQFMAKCDAKDLRVDFIAMHTYPGPDVEAFLDQVQRVHEYYGKPVWITEYAVADWDASRRQPSKHSGKEIRSFMEGTVQGLREMSYVERFAWKTRAADDPVMGESAIFQKDGSLTRTGELYRSL